MVTEKIATNASDLDKELVWFKEILKTRSALNANRETPYKSLEEIGPPYFNGSTSGFAQFVRKYELNFQERFLVILAMVPHVKPELLDAFLVKNNSTQQIYTEFGGKVGKDHTGFLPTGETAMFILAGSDLSKRFALQLVFENSHIFARERILWLEDVNKGEPFLGGALTVSQEVLDLFTTGEVRKPVFSQQFPAKLLTTKMEWEDLVLPNAVGNRILEIETWLHHHQELMEDWGMARKLKPGYRALFYGPPGTGKTLTAALLGKRIGADVYQIDLSKVVSKYIGETEKNLSRVFDRAENKDWILFFDEAEALFGKRTQVNDAHDRYANQEVAYLLQRIEDYNGLVILATNLKSNLDDAFTRRFQAMVHFPVPKSDERLKLWQSGFPELVQIEERINLREISKKYELAGGSIINIVQYCLLMALKRRDQTVQLQDLIEGVRREFHKSGMTL